VLINEDVPQVLVKMPAPIEVIIDDQKGDDAEWSKYLNQWFKK
jgi:general stress protein 26